MASNPTLASFWSKTGGAGPSTASLPSTSTSDVSESRSATGSSGCDHESETDSETESLDSREMHESAGPRRLFSSYNTHAAPMRFVGLQVQPLSSLTSSLTTPPV